MIVPMTLLAMNLMGAAGPSSSPTGHIGISEPNPSLITTQTGGADVWPTLAQQIMTDLSTGKFELVQQMSDATMQQQLPAGKLSDVWTQITGQVGNFQSIVSSKVVSKTPYYVVIADCKFDKMDLDATISFDDQQHLAGLFFKPHVQEEAAGSVPLPSGLTEQSITVGEGGKWPLPGTLTLPAGKGPFPAVVLVHGSGPNDRDETILGNKPFRDIAWGLAEHGIAVLRYDKRTEKYGAQMMALSSLTVDDEATDDAVLAAKMLRQTENVNPKDIYVVGHSLGAMLIPRIAERTPFAAGYVVMAAPTQPLEDELLSQITARTKDMPPAEAEQVLSQYRAQIAAVKSASLSEKTPASTLPFNTPPSYWLDFRNYHAAQLAKSIAKPLLVLQGDDDFQVLPSNLQIWKTTLAGKRNVTYHLYPGLSHLFMTGQPTPDDYQAHPGHVDPKVITDIAAWIKSVDMMQGLAASAKVHL